MTPKHSPSPRFGNLIFPLVAIFAILGLTSCNLPDFSLPMVDPGPAEGEPAAPATEALVTFYLQVPANTPPDQPVLISILDEVTGLALNARRYDLSPTGNGGYSIGLPFPVGSTIKYRYSRRSEVLAEEHTTDGRAVRYRMVHVDGPGEVYDVVSRWNDTRFEGNTGRISGTVTDAANGSPVPGLLVTAGGAQVITASDGRFLIEGLPPGTHNIVVIAPDGAYRTFQQGAVVATESTTPAPIQVHTAPKVDITFILRVPEDSPPIVPIRMAGNIYQLGNTFADLSGGVSTLASRMPVLSPLPDGTYGVILGLPAGTALQYKYTLGDGFWNTERAQNGDWVLRQLVVPDEPTVIEDTVQTWQVGAKAPITFDITVPESTPPDDGIFIQFNPYGWTEPLPMWHLGEERWAYILYSPLDMLEKLGYRYCRAGQCGHADDARTPGVFTSGQVVQTAEDPQGIPDRIETWAWFGNNPNSSLDLSQIVVEEAHSPDFIAGIEFQERFHPSWISRLPFTMADVSALNANWVVLTPSWTFTRANPPVLEPVAGQDPMWLETVESIRKAKNNNLNVAIHPVSHFPTRVDEWWISAPRDFSWWVSWFDRYQAFAIHHADLAERNGISTLILGGDWMAPAMPSGKLGDGSPSGVPPDAEARYRELIAEVRNHFSGKLGWALSYPQDILEAPGFIQDVDLLYILWSEPLSDDPQASVADMQVKAERILSTDLYAMWLSWEMEKEEKGIIISLAYPSINGSATGCIADPILECIPPGSINYPAPDYPMLELDLGAQARAYHAMLGAISQYRWISGVTSRGYYPPTVLQDKSISIHGKPAEDVLRAWYAQFTAQGD